MTDNIYDLSGCKCKVQTSLDVEKYDEFEGVFVSFLPITENFTFAIFEIVKGKKTYPVLVNIDRLISVQVLDPVKISNSPTEQRDVS